MSNQDEQPYLPEQSDEEVKDTYLQNNPNQYNGDNNNYKQNEDQNQYQQQQAHYETIEKYSNQNQDQQNPHQQFNQGHTSNNANQQQNYGLGEYVEGEYDDGGAPEDVPIEIEDFDLGRKDMYSYMSMGFDKKYRDLHPLNNKTYDIDVHNIGGTATGYDNQIPMQPKTYGTLEAKANLIQPSKGLSYYQTKGDMNFNIQNGRPIQMISVDDQGLWRLTEEAHDELVKVEAPISFVSIIGEQKSGKSFLMNHLMEVDNERGFQSEDDLSTKGIIMWSAPTYNPQTNSYIFFLDTQEISDSQDRQVREKLQFVITCLISQIMLVNVVGDLGINSLNPLADLADITEFIDLTNQDDKEELANIFPRMLYILRDNKHVVQEKGHTVAMHTYLDNFIYSEEKYKKGNPVEQKIRRRIVKYFRNRDAFSMVCPANNQQELEDLKSLPRNELAKSFQDELGALRKKLVFHSKKKEIRGVYMSPTITISFINSILEDINNTFQIKLDKAFSILIDNEFIMVYNHAIETYNEHLSNSFGDIEFKSFHELYQVLREAREKCFNIFYQLKAHDVAMAQKFFQEYFDRLNNFIKEKEAKLIEFNSTKQKEILMKQVEETMKVTKIQTSNSSFRAEDLQVIVHNYQDLIDTVLMQAQGGNPDADPVTLVVKKVQADLSSQFIREIMEAQNLSTEQKKKLQQAQNDAQQVHGNLSGKIKDHEQEIKKGKGEINALNEKIEKQKKEIEDLKKKNKAQAQDIQKLNQEKAALEDQVQIYQKKAAKGCCG